MESYKEIVPKTLGENESIYHLNQPGTGYQTKLKRDSNLWCSVKVSWELVMKKNSFSLCLCVSSKMINYITALPSTHEGREIHSLLELSPCASASFPAPTKAAETQTFELSLKRSRSLLLGTRDLQACGGVTLLPRSCLGVVQYGPAESAYILMNRLNQCIFAGVLHLPTSGQIL